MVLFPREVLFAGKETNVELRDAIGAGVVALDWLVVVRFVLVVLFERLLFSHCGKEKELKIIWPA